MYYFVSDIHLGVLKREEDKVREKLFLDLLDAVSNDAVKIFLIGDIFDYWFDYNTVIPKYFYRTLTKFAEIQSKGIEIVYLMGNHDFGHYRFFQEELGIKVVRNDIEAILSNKKIYLAHGDGKAYNDTGYLILKKILRSQWANFIFRCIHPDLGIRLASSTSQTSRAYTDKKEYSQKDGLKTFAFKKIEEGFDYVIMGHRHISEFTKHPKLCGEYINLGEWINNPQVGILSENKFELIPVFDFIKRKKIMNYL